MTCLLIFICIKNDPWEKSTESKQAFSATLLRF